MLRNSIFYFKEFDEAKFLEICSLNHMLEEPYFFHSELTDDAVAEINHNSKIPAHKVYFKYDKAKKITGVEIENSTHLQWIDNFAIFYDFPQSFKDRLFKLFPNKIFASLHGGEPTLSPVNVE